MHVGPSPAQPTLRNGPARMPSELGLVGARPFPQAKHDVYLSNFRSGPGQPTGVVPNIPKILNNVTYAQLV